RTAHTCHFRQVRRWKTDRDWVQELSAVWNPPHPPTPLCLVRRPLPGGQRSASKAQPSRRVRGLSHTTSRYRTPGTRNGGGAIETRKTTGEPFSGRPTTGG